MARENTRGRGRQAEDDDEDTPAPKRGAKAEAAPAGGGISLRSKDAIQTGIYAGGRATVSFIFGKFDYGARGKHDALIVTYTDENNEPHEEPYGIGSGWAVAKDGSRLIPRAGQTGLPNSCDAILYMFGPLEEAAEAAGIELPDTDDVTALDGMVVQCMQRPVQKRDFRDDRRNAKAGPNDDRQKMKLVITEILEAPWVEGGAKKTAKVTPIAAGRKGAKPAADDDDDDAQPTGKTPPLGKGTTAGKKGAVAEPEDDDELDTMTIEALVEALEDESPLMVEDLEATLLAQLKGNPDRKRIAGRAVEEEFLAIAEGWKFNAKKGIVSLA